MQLDSGNLGDLAAGCAVFGGGGGGDPRIGLLMAEEAIRQHGPVELLGLDDLDDDAFIMPCGMIGAPTVMVEKLPSGDECGVIRDAFESQLGRRISAVMPFELGGINGVLPVAWAAHAGLPLVDGDFMGRAFPELQMLTPHLLGMSGSPAIISDERSQTITFNTMNNMWLERLVRTAVAAFGGSACGVIYPMTVADARRPIIAGTISRALQVGAAIRTGTDDPVAAIREALPVCVLGYGKVADIDRQTAGGFVRGSATIEGIGESAGRLFRLEFQNENLVLLEAGRPVATVPDIITLLDSHTGEAVVTEGVRFGQRVTIVAFDAPEPWTSDAGLATVGPRAFGYDLDYEPVVTTAPSSREAQR